MRTPTRIGTREPTGEPLEPVVVTVFPRWLIGVAVVLAVGLVALGAWVIVDRSGDATLPADQVRSVVERSIAAWNVGDEEAILQLYAPDGTFDIGRSLTSAESIAGYVGELDAMGLVVEQRSPVVVEGNTAITVVAYGGADDMSLTQSVIQLNDDGLIVSHTGEDVRGVNVIEG